MFPVPVADEEDVDQGGGYSLGVKQFRIPLTENGRGVNFYAISDKTFVSNRRNLLKLTPWTP